MASCVAGVDGAERATAVLAAAAQCDTATQQGGGISAPCRARQPYQSKHRSAASTFILSLFWNCLTG